MLTQALHCGLAPCPHHPLMQKTMVSGLVVRQSLQQGLQVHPIHGLFDTHDMAGAAQQDSASQAKHDDCGWHCLDYHVAAHTLPTPFMSEPNSKQRLELVQEVSPSTSATPSAEGPPKSSYESSYSSSYSSYCACCACALMAALSAAPALSKNRDTPCEQSHRYSPQKTASRQAFLSRCHPLAPNLYGSHGKFSARYVHVWTRVTTDVHPSGDETLHNLSSNLKISKTST